MTRLLAVHPHPAVIVDSTEIEQRAVVAHRHSLEAFLEPDGALVEKQALILRIPITRDLHGRRLIEIVLYQVLRALGFGIHEESIAHGFHTIVVVALFLYIDNVIPLTIE